jgi:LPXTG-site transpeptidase (sortase) family protein
MFNSKYNNVLTIILIVVIIAIIALVGFFGYNYWKESKDIEDAKAAVDNYKSKTENDDKSDEVDTEAVDESGEDVDLSGEINSTPDTSTGTSSSSTQTYKGFEMIGTIEIPTTNVSYPILSANAYSKTALETSIVQLYGVNPNEVGNMVLVGHNYRNNKFFSNNKKLSIGDKIYITDSSKNTVTYTIYNKYETTQEDTAYMQRDTEGKREISLSTCTDDGTARLIIWASAD